MYAPRQGMVEGFSSRQDIVPIDNWASVHKTLCRLLRQNGEQEFKEELHKTLRPHFARVIHKKALLGDGFNDFFALLPIKAILYRRVVATKNVVGQGLKDLMPFANICIK